MNCYILYVTETRGEAAELARELNRVAAPDRALVAGPAAGSLKKPYRHLVFTTSETLAKNGKLLLAVRARVDAPRFPTLRLAKERAFDVLTRAVEGLTRLIRRAKGEKP